MSKHLNHEGHDERTTKIMLDVPITPLSRYIGSKWYLTLEQLSERTGLKLTTILKAVRGEPILPAYERRLRKFLDKL